MSIVPVIGRELRSQARQPLTYMLRLVGAAAICLALWLAFSTMQLFNSTNMEATPSLITQRLSFQYFGAALFGKLNFAIFVAIWLFVPLACADAISRERREGTLPLLQLTRLKPWEIVFGKSFVHMLRSSSIFLTMVPWLFIPLLFGGVGLEDFQMALVLDFAALFLAQSAGLLASTFSRDWLKAVIWAEALGVMMFLLMANSFEYVTRTAFENGATPPARWWGVPRDLPWWYHVYDSVPHGFLDRHQRLLDLLTNGSVHYRHTWMAGIPSETKMESTWQQAWTSLTPEGELLWKSGAGGLLLFSMGTFLAAIFLSSQVVKRTWRLGAGAAWTGKIREKYLKPKYRVEALRRSLSHSLSRNPIGWLHHYSPSARLTKWGWCLFLILAELFFTSNPDDLYVAQSGLGFFLVLGILFSSTGSFRHELESGAFELLLVTPIREMQILAGRVRGIWQQFLPAFLIYTAGALFLATGWRDPTIAAKARESITVFSILLLTAPVIGLCFSLLRWNFLVAWLCASGLTLFPLLISVKPHGVQFPRLILWQLLVTAVCALGVSLRLRNRLSLTVRG